jgi:undecaprenyl-diphosphatase
MERLQEIFRSVVLGVVQGLTEFLPVSSSFHLRLIPAVFGWPEIGIAFSAFLHLGTLLAVLIYFSKDLLTISSEGWTQLTQPHFSIVRFTNSLAWKILLGTIPAVLLGLFFHDQLEKLDSNFWLTSSCLIIVGVFLWVSDLSPSSKNNLSEMKSRNSIAIGIGQAVALIPGVSRSGATISTGRLFGFSREDAARFSFLLGVPVILGAGLLEMYKVFKNPSQMEFSLLACFIGCLTAALVGYFAIDFLIKFLQKSSLLPFVIYRIIVGTLSLVFVAHNLSK